MRKRAAFAVLGTVTVLAGFAAPGAYAGETQTDVQAVYTSSTGNLTTTVPASEDGYWRWNFAGTSTTPPVKATGDFVDAQ
ncbi:hypothetical protein [Streptomyces sp. NPDC048710]|uniref:hypothetical protein n=1 Tax=Streptomyces sp. NPDC048710 TaxID=3365586 RepID=UPI003710CF2F